MNIKTGAKTGMTAETCLEYLNAAIQEQGLECYMLVDCFLGYPFNDHLENYGIASKDIQRLTVFFPAPGNARDPLLIRMKKGSPLTLEFLEVAVKESLESTLKSRRICAFIASKATLPKLAEHIERRAGKHRMAKTEERTEFRFFDPRVMRAVEPMLNDLQKTVLFGPIRLWAYADEHGKCRIIEHHGKTTYVSGLQLTPIQEATLSTNIYVQYALHRLRKYRPAWDEDIPARLTKHIIEGICAERLRDDDSIAGYGVARWLIEHGHLKPEHLAQALEKHRATSLDIESAIDVLSPGVL
jgi:hypothetical protein